MAALPQKRAKAIKARPRGAGEKSMRPTLERIRRYDAQMLRAAANRAGASARAGSRKLEGMRLQDILERRSAQISTMRLPK